MKQYNEIKYFGHYWDIPIVAFDKMDGSNLRFEYSHKRGFYKFGTKKMMIDSKHETFGFAVDLFLNKYTDNLSYIFKDKQYRNILSFVCYAELYGSKSEFGQHDFVDDTFDVTLFDIDQYKKGLMPPKQFISDFKELGVYSGNLNKEFVKSVRENEYGLTEGVICKGVVESRKNNNLYYCKIKTNEWFERLRLKESDLYKKEISQIERNQNEQVE